MVEQKLLNKLEEIKDKHFSNDLLLIYYNPHIRNPMHVIDMDSLFAYLGQMTTKRVTVVLYGSGGNLKAGAAMGELLQKKLEYFECFLPFSCCSSMC